MQAFTAKVAVITGAGSGLGREFALLGAKLGMRLVLADVNQEGLQQTSQDAAALGAEVLSQLCDVRHGEQLESLSQTALQMIAGVIEHAPAIAAFTNPTVGGGAPRAVWIW